MDGNALTPAPTSCQRPFPDEESSAAGPEATQTGTPNAAIDPLHLRSLSMANSDASMFQAAAIQSQDCESTGEIRI